MSHLLAQVQAPQEHEQERAALTVQVTDLDRKIAHRLDLAEDGGPDVAARLKERRRQRDKLTARLEHLQGPSLADLPDSTTPEGIARPGTRPSRPSWPT